MNYRLTEQKRCANDEQALISTGIRLSGPVRFDVCEIGSVSAPSGRKGETEDRRQSEVRLYVVLSTTQPRFQGGHKGVLADLHETGSTAALLDYDRRTPGD